MTWFKVDDGFALHPKAALAGNSAIGLWTRGGSWCAAHLTDGRLPRAMLAPLGGRARDAARLVNVGLWVPDGDHYIYKDWEQYQPSRDNVRARQKADADRKAEWRRKQQEQESQRDSERTDGVTDGGIPEESAHTRPDPTRPKVKDLDQDHLSMPDRTGASNGDRPKINKQADPTRVASILGTDETWAQKVITQVLDRAPADVTNPQAYVEAAIRERPEDYQPTRTPPRPDQLCEHGRERATCPFEEGP